MRLPLDFKENVPRSVRNLSLEKRTTFNAGVVIPILFEKIYPNDKFEIDFSTLLQSNPLVAPLMGQYVLQTNFFFEPDSNLYGWLDNNAKLLASEIIAKKRHTLGPNALPHYIDDSGVSYDTAFQNPCCRGSVLDYIGFPVCSFPNKSWYNNNGDGIVADRLLAYLDIIRTYYMPTQTSSVLYVRENSNPDSQLGAVSRQDLDNLFRFLRNQQDGLKLTTQVWSNSDLLAMPSIGTYLYDVSRGGLFCTPYLPDMMRNLLLDVESSKVNVEVNNNEFSIDTLRFKNKLQRLVDRYDLSGGRFSNWLRTVWGTSAGRRLDIPQLIGSTSLIIDPTNITSTANTYTETAGSEIGQLAGNINQSNFKAKNKNKNFKYYFTSNEPGTLVCCVSLIPKVDYSQGFDKGLTDTLFSSDYKPQFAQLGYQDVPASNYSAIPSINDANSTITQQLDTVVGKQIAWMDLMSNVNRVHGEFTDGGYYESWVLRRRYTEIHSFRDDNRTIPSSSTYTAPSYYVDPRQYTYMFANTDFRDDNFMFQIAFSIRAVRPIGKRFMPTLE